MSVHCCYIRDTLISKLGIATVRSCSSIVKFFFNGSSCTETELVSFLLTVIGMHFLSKKIVDMMSATGTSVV